MSGRSPGVVGPVGVIAFAWADSAQSALPLVLYTDNAQKKKKKKKCMWTHGRTPFHCSAAPAAAPRSLVERLAGRLDAPTVPTLPTDRLSRMHTDTHGRTLFHRSAAPAAPRTLWERLAGRLDSPTVLTVNDVLNLGVSPGKLLAAVRRRFEGAGGTVLEHTALSRVQVGGPLFVLCLFF